MSRAKSKVATVVVRGPLAPFANAYEVALHELGYTPLGTVKQLRQVARLSRWLEQAGMEAADLTAGVLERFLGAWPRLERLRRRDWRRWWWCFGVLAWSATLNSL